MKGDRETKVKGFACRISDASVVQAIHDVLSRIKERRPQDYARLQKRVVRFERLPIRDVKNGVRGRCKSLAVPKRLVVAAERRVERAENVEDLSRAMLQREQLGETHKRCVVQIETNIKSSSNMVGIIAHELGHAAGTREDVDNRGGGPRGEEWAHEAVADMYAYRWGFAREIRRTEKSREWTHHGILPGGTVEFSDPLPDGTVRWHKFRMTRSFYLRPVT